MSLSTEQLRLKEEGNTALGAGDAARALALFSEALETSGGSDAGRAILYSNRSAAYMLIKDHQSALDDSEACIRLDADFAKGWSRKAAALHAMGELSKAASFYKIAASKAKNSDLAEEYNRLAERCSASVGTEDASTRRQSTTASSTTSTSRMNIVYPPSVLALRLISFIMVFAWLFTGDKQNYMYSMLAMAAASMTGILLDIGRPQFTAQYAERFIGHSTKPLFLLPLVYASMAPVFPAMMNTQLIALAPLIKNVHQLAVRVAPGPASLVATRVKNSPALGNAMGIPEWASLSTEERFARFDETMENICSRFELSVMVILLLMMLTPSGNFVWILIYLQVLKLRYLTYEPSKRAIHSVDRFLTNYASRYNILNLAYQPVRRAVVWFGTQGINQVQARRQNPLANCTIM